MFLSKRKNGFWYIYYEQKNDKRSCISAKSKLKSEALKFLANFEGELKGRRQLKVIPITLLTFSNDYLKFSESIHRSKTTCQIKTILKELQTFAGNLQIYEITKPKAYR